jgi:hypothetical protein
MEQENMQRVKRNKEIILQEIMNKNTHKPYFPGKLIYSVENDYDTFPYPRWFKGVPTEDRPIISEREAGWVPKKINKTIRPKKSEFKTPNLCFQTPCSTVYPCYAQDSSYISSNKACVNQYR